jgi:hypothetical protein
MGNAETFGRRALKVLPQRSEKWDNLQGSKVLPTNTKGSPLNRLIQETKKIKVQNSYKIHA